jgi:hypothetical protein
MLLGNQAMEIFALSVFPLGFVLFSLLVVSKVCCEWLQQKVIEFVDALLFFKCCGERSLTVFWVIMLVTVAVMATAVFSYQHIVGQRFNKHDCWTESCWNDHDKLLKRMEKAERNVWISVFAFTLFVAIHRLRHHIKHHLILIDALDDAIKELEGAGLKAVADRLKERTGRDGGCCGGGSKPGEVVFDGPPPADAEATRLLQSDGAATSSDDPERGASAPPAAAVVVAAKAVAVENVQRDEKEEKAAVVS